MIESLMTLIVSMCSFNNPTLSKEYKRSCMEHYVNCMVGINGEINMGKLPMCEDRWLMKGAQRGEG